MNTCPTHNAFTFSNVCRVDVCLYHSLQARHGCIVLGRKESDTGAMSDEEARFYKTERGEDFWQLKGKAEVRVRRLMMLKKFVDFIAESNLAARPIMRLEGLLQRMPFNVKELNITPERLPLLFRRDLYHTFTEGFSFAALPGSSSSVTQYGMLFMNKDRFERLRALVEGSKS